MTGDHYDSDDARNCSPSLEPTKVDYEPHDSPVPFISDKSESPKGESNPKKQKDCKSPHRRRKDPNTSLSVRQILMSLGADRPELVNHLVTKPYPSQVSSDSGDSGGVSPVEDYGEQRDVPMPDAGSVTATHAAQNLTLLTADNSEPNTVGPSTSNRSAGFYEDNRLPLNRMQPITSRLDHIAGGQNGRLSALSHTAHGHELPRITTNYLAEERSIATSPNLRPHAISPSEQQASRTLPAFQSLPQPSSVNSPTTILPSLKATFPEELSETRLKDQSSWFNGTSPLPLATSSPPFPLSPLECGRRPPEQFLQPPLSSGKPYIHISPANSQTLSTISSTPSTAPSQQSPWHLSSRSERSFTISSGDSSSQLAETPTSAGYPSPNESRQSFAIEQTLSEEKMLEPGEPAGAGGFKCSFPGCTAAPFQTQYLLK